MEKLEMGEAGGRGEKLEMGEAGGEGRSWRLEMLEMVAELWNPKAPGSMGLCLVWERKSPDDLRLVIGLLLVNRYLLSNYHVWALGLALGNSCEQVSVLDVYIMRWRSRDL